MRCVAMRCDFSTPLFKAAHKGYTSVVEQLLKHQPNLGLLPNGESAMHATCLFGHLAVVKQLIGAGFCHFQLRNQDGLTPKMVAKREGYVGVYDYLEEREQEHRERNGASERYANNNY